MSSPDIVSSKKIFHCECGKVLEFIQEEGHSEYTPTARCECGRVYYAFLDVDKGMTIIPAVDNA